MRRWIVLLVILAWASPSFSQTASSPPKYIDDDELFDSFVEKLSELAKAKKCLSAEEIAKRIELPKKLPKSITLAKPKETVLAPEDVYQAILPSVVIIGSVKPAEEDKDEFEDGGFGTAWCLSADGIFMTNRHIFANAKNELFGIGTQGGDVYAVTDILAVDPVSDIAIFKVSGKGFTPLALAEKSARVGSWVGTLGHPGNNLFTFTQGYVTRYSKQKVDDSVERWMNVTAEYAQGSSGGPVVDRCGNVVGMAAMTVNLDAVDEAKPDDPVKPAGDPPSSTLQMVVKLTVPLMNLRKIVNLK